MNKSRNIISPPLIMFRLVHVREMKMFIYILLMYLLKRVDCHAYPKYPTDTNNETQWKTYLAELQSYLAATTTAHSRPFSFYFMVATITIIAALLFFFFCWPLILRAWYYLGGLLHAVVRKIIVTLYFGRLKSHVPTWIRDGNVGRFLLFLRDLSKPFYTKALMWAGLSVDKIAEWTGLTTLTAVDKLRELGEKYLADVLPTGLTNVKTKDELLNYAKSKLLDDDGKAMAYIPGQSDDLQALAAYRRFLVTIHSGKYMLAKIVPSLFRARDALASYSNPAGSEFLGKVGANLYKTFGSPSLPINHYKARSVAVFVRGDNRENLLDPHTRSFYGFDKMITSGPKPKPPAPFRFEWPNSDAVTIPPEDVPSEKEILISLLDQEVNKDKKSESRPGPKAEPEDPDENQPQKGNFTVVRRIWKHPAYILIASMDTRALAAIRQELPALFVEKGLPEGAFSYECEKADVPAACVASLIAAVSANVTSMIGTMSRADSCTAYTRLLIGQAIVDACTRQAKNLGIPSSVDLPPLCDAVASHFLSKSGQETMLMCSAQRFDETFRVVVATGLRLKSLCHQ